MDNRLKIRKIRGLKTAWIENGPKSPNVPILLLLHGFPDGPHVWDPQAEEFEKKFLVIRPYVRGLYPFPAEFGLSRYSIDSITLDILAILKTVDPKGQRPVFCVGHDLGVAHAWNLAPLLGDRLSGLVVINGLSLIQFFRRLKDPSQNLKSWYIYLMQLPKVPELVAQMAPQWFLKRVYEIANLPVPIRPTGVDLEQFVRLPLNQYRAFVRDMPKLLRRGQEKIKRPVLVLWGKNDAFLNTPSVDELEPYASNVTMRILEGNHWLFRENPVAVNQLLDNFFTSQEVRYEKIA